MQPWQVVVSATFQLAAGDVRASEAQLAEIVRWRREHQPGGQNAGSVFTNPPGRCGSEKIRRLSPVAAIAAAVAPW